MKYQIPVYWRSYSTRYYLTHPWYLVKDIWTAYKNRRARARKGYAWVDLWNFDTYLGKMVPNALDELADKSHGAPFGDFEGSRWIEFEDWQAELHVLASLMRLANMDKLCDEEEFNKKFEEWRAGTLLQPIKDMQFHNEYVLSADAAAKIDNAKNHWACTEAQYNALIDVIFDRLKRVYSSLWD